tara:strand:+ start:865 stop:1458 length:594 start_codon:yes stop_codon:yes gene_type:complete
MNQLDSAQTPAAAQQTNAANAAIPDKDTNISNVLSHLQKLEEHNKSLEAKLLAADDRIQSLSAEKRAGMKSALDTFIKNWVNANEADETVKEKFFQGVESLAEKADEGNGVWKMMVAASNLHARQEHDLDKLRTENTDLKQRVDGMYGTSESRTGDKRARLDRGDRVDGTQAANDAADQEPARDSIWADFASSMAQF